MSAAGGLLHPLGITRGEAQRPAVSVGAVSSGRQDEPGEAGRQRGAQPKQIHRMPCTEQKPELKRNRMNNERTYATATKVEYTPKSTACGRRRLSVRVSPWAERETEGRGAQRHAPGGQQQPTRKTKQKAAADLTHRQRRGQRLVGVIGRGSVERARRRGRSRGAGGGGTRHHRSLVGAGEQSWRTLTQRGLLSAGTRPEHRRSAAHSTRRGARQLHWRPRRGTERQPRRTGLPRGVTSHRGREKAV